MTSCIQRSSNWEKGIFLIMLWSGKSALCYQPNIFWYVLMNYHHFDLQSLSPGAHSSRPASAARGGCAWCWEALLPSGLNSQCFYLIEEALRWSSRMRCKLCFALLERFDVQRGNCLSLVLFCQCNMCYCSSVEQKLLFLNAKRSLENVTKFTKRI